MNKLRLKIRIILWSILALAVFVFVYLAVVPDGYMVYENNFSGSIWHGQNFIEKFSPAERVENGHGFIKISGDPVYFSLFTPRKFEKARITMTYKNLNEAQNPVMELGLLMDKTVWAYKMEPLQNKLIENLSNSWTKIESNGLTFLQRTKKYNNLDQFLQSNPKREDLALYNYDLKAPFVLSDYKSTSSWQNYPSLRGAYQFYVYIKKEDLNLKLELARLENLDTPDEAIVLVSDQAGQEVFRQNISDSKKLDLNLKNLKEGTYKVELRTGDNIITKSLATTQNKLVFINRVWAMTPTEFLADNNIVKVRTVAPASMGEFNFGGEKFNIDKTYEPFNFNLNSHAEFNAVKTNHPDLIVESNGLFAFSEAAYFNPDFKRFNADLDLSKINYVLANYQAPTELNGDKVVTLDFELSNAYREFNKNSFMISIPGADSSTDIIIKDVKIQLWGQNIIEKIKQSL
ncbi:MAG: hypothetical protein WCK37_04310 [Candidatus Falkowbacteria bacterium]